MSNFQGSAIQEKFKILKALSVNSRPWMRGVVLSAQHIQATNFIINLLFD